MPAPLPPSQDWWVNDQTPDNPFGKSEDYEAFLDYLGALPRSLSPAIAAEPLVINVVEDDGKGGRTLIERITVTQGKPLHIEVFDDEQQA